MKKLIACILLVLIVCLGVVGCGKNEEALEAAKTYLEQRQAEIVSASTTPGDYEVDGKVIIDGKTYTVEWSVNVENGVKVVVAEDGTVTIDVDDEAEADIAYTLTATIKDEDGNSIQTSFNYTVPKFVELTWQQFYDKKDDDAVVIKGVITGIVETTKENDLYLEDANGGYFVYALEKKPSELGLKVGMTVRVRGLRDTYQGIAQVAKASVEILDSTIKTVTPLDITEDFKNAEDLADDLLFLKQSRFVTIKGATVLGQSKSNSTYYNFALAGKNSYVRISSSTSMLTKDQETAFKKAVADNIGKNADITGLVSVYGGNIYIIPVDDKAFSNFVLINRTPAEQVEFEKGLLSVTDKILENTTIELPTAGQLYDTVTVSWAVSASEFATLDGNKLTVTLPDEASKITLTATIKSGEATATATYEITVNAMSKFVAKPIDTAPVVGTKYKFALKHSTIGKTLYFNGSKSGTQYLATTTDSSKAVDVFLEAVEGEEGKYYLAYMDGAAKYYIALYYSEEAAKPIITAENIRPETKFVYNSEIGSVVVEDIGEDADNLSDYYIGTYGTYETFATSDISYADNSGSFVAKFCTVINLDEVSDENKVAAEKATLSLPEEVKLDGQKITLPAYGELYTRVTITWALGENVTGATIENGVLTVNFEKDARDITVIATLKHGEKTDTKTFTIAVDALPTKIPQKVTELKTGVAYKLGIYQANLGHIIYFNGVEGYKDYYFGSTAIFAEGVDVFLEAATGEGNYYLYTMDNGAKKYIGAVTDKGHINPKYLDTATTVFTIDTTLGTIVTTIDDAQYTYSTYKNYDSISVNETGSDTTFYCGLYELVDLSSITDDDKVAEEKEKLTFNVKEVTTAGTVNLPSTPNTHKDVTITWAVSENALATLEGNILTVTLPAADTDDVVVVLTATIKCGEATETKTFNLKIVAPVTEPTPISEVLEAAEEGTYFVSGVVVAVNNKSFLLKDSSAYILVYVNSTPTVAVGDKINLNGTTTTYKSTGVRQFSNTGLEIEKIGTETVTHPNPAVLDGAAFNEVATSEYVKVTGVLVKSNSFFNLYVDGSATPGSLTYLAGDLLTAANDLAGKLVEVVGYTTGNTGSYINLMVTSVTEAEATDAKKIEIEKEALSITTQFSANGTLTLPATGAAYTGVAITWTVNGDAVVDSYTITQTEQAQVFTVVATLSCGEAETLTKTFTVNVSARYDGTIVEYTAAQIGEAVVGDGYTSDDNNISIKAEVGTNTQNTPLYSTQIRVYSSSKGANTFTVSVASGYKIDKVVITASGTSYLGGNINMNSEDADWSCTTDGTTLTFVQATTGTDGTLVLIPSSQFRIVNIQIYYAEVPASE